ncbi:MAG: hypothetical protein BWY66_02421 [bacterium ADurb.Bin374]|nr:MAG: hypothetical protein BWY66_02421 [bacterium ADurb.Bin374]
MDRISQNNTYQPPWMIRRETVPAPAERRNAALPAQAQPEAQKAAPAQQAPSTPIPRLGQNIDVRA